MVVTRTYAVGMILLAPGISETTGITGTGLASKMGEAWLAGTTILRADVKFMAGDRLHANTLSRFQNDKRFRADSSFSAE